MKVLKDCWNSVGADDCDFGTHHIDGTTATIYLYDGLDVGKEMSRFFSRRNEHGYVGHCLLVFRGVKAFERSVRPYEYRQGAIVWLERSMERYEGVAIGGTKKHFLGGSVHGCHAYVAVEVDAQQFEIHILDADKPVPGA